jgi:hypothetical protein
MPDFNAPCKLTKNLKGTKNMRAAQRILMACLICLPTAAFADVYPLNPPPDLFIDTFSVVAPSGSMQDVSFAGTVEAITDQSAGGCSSGCFAGLDFVQSDGTFSVNDGDGTNYLTGTLIDSLIEPGGEVGELFTVGIDNTAAWTALESEDLGAFNAASSFGGTVVMDLHLFDPTTGGASNAVADLTPAVPEPASWTLLLTGLAAGLSRKRWALKKS